MGARLRHILAMSAMSLLIIVIAVGLAYSFPADLAMLAAVDLSVYVDALVGAYLVASLVKVRPALQLARSAIRAVGRRLGGRRKRSRSRIQRPAASRADNDDGPPSRVIVLAA
jgi:hypothetical protein